MIKPAFTLCFLLHGEEVLMLHRRFPPNQGLWNGVGGHIEPGETPQQAVIREVAEETGYGISNPEFAGLLTWDGFEIPPGGIAIFTAVVPHKKFVNNHEGNLAWKSREWACSASEVVDNIHVFLPRILAGDPPLHFHFSYIEGVRVKDQIAALPSDFNLDAIFHPEDGFAEDQRGEFLLSFSKERLQISVIEELLTQQTYWAEERSRQVIERSVQNSVCLGIYQQGVQVAFARLVTDDATFAWLCDVIVDEDLRGCGLGKWLVEAACRYCDSRGIDMTLLATRDAQSLYESYGDFQILDDPTKWMRRNLPDS